MIICTMSVFNENFDIHSYKTFKKILRNPTSSWMARARCFDFSAIFFNKFIHSTCQPCGMIRIGLHA